MAHSWDLVSQINTAAAYSLARVLTCYVNQLKSALDSASRFLNLRFILLAAKSVRKEQNQCSESILLPFCSSPTAAGATLISGEIKQKVF